VKLHLSSIALSVLLLAGCQALNSGSAAVVGTGDPAKDVAAVQAAVDRGGMVALRGSFDFGERGRVNIRRDVDIVGIDGARIHGGFWTFYSPVPEALPPTGAAEPGPKIAIRNIQFDGALWGPINIGYASGLVVSGNRITAVRPHPLPMPGFADGEANCGIFFGAAWAQEFKTRRYVPGVFTGRVAIEDNVIDMQSANPGRTLGYGIFGQWTTGIDASIARNTISNGSRTGIETIDHYRGSDGQGRIRMTANKVTTPRQGLPFPGKQAPNAVLVGYFSDRSAAADASRSIDMEVVANTIETRGAASVGVIVLANGARVKGNTISGSGSASMSVTIPASDVEFSGNTLRGSGIAAVGIGPFDVLTASRNRLTDNDLRDFQATRSHVVFSKGSADNVCSGHQFIIKISDEGLRNRCP
jgi:hypothetical protein